MNEQKLGPHPLSAADRGSLLFLLVIGAATAVSGIAFSVMRIFEVLLGESISVTADLSGNELGLTTDLDATLPVTVDTATFTVDSLPTAAFVSAITQPVLIIVMTLGISVSVAILARNILRGRVFTKGNTAALVTSWAFGVVGLVPQPALQWNIAEGALSQAGIDTTGLLGIQFSPLPFIALAILIAITTHAFSVGTKIQRETEGLI